MIKWMYKPSGNCPIQSEGYFLGYYFYFRARWAKATMEFCNSKDDWENDKDIKFYELHHTEPYYAGWLSERFCLFLIYTGCFKFLFHILKTKIKKI